MNLHTPEITKIIWYWAWKVAKCCPIESSDAAQELWMEAAAQARTWDEAKHAALSSYIYTAVRWRALKLIRNSVRSSKAEEMFVAEVSPPAVCPPQTETMGTVMSRVRQALRDETTMRVFDTLTSPPKELLTIARRTRKVDMVGEKATIKDLHIAHFLSVSTMTVSRSIKKIKKVLETEAYGEKEERRDASG